jgi:predicted ATPase
LALAAAYPGGICVENVPQLDSSRHNEARRFVTFVDVVYEQGGLLALRAHVPLDRLFAAQNVFAAPAASSDEMLSGDGASEATASEVAAALDAPVASTPAADGSVAGPGGGGGGSSSRSRRRAGPMAASAAPRRTPLGSPANDDAGVGVWVASSGGSSGRGTTMVGGAEWSATGRVGVSLAEYSAVKDVGFAFARAKSRLVEMQTPQYVRKHVERQQAAAAAAAAAARKLQK